MLLSRFHSRFRRRSRPPRNLPILNRGLATPSSVPNMVTRNTKMRRMADWSFSHKFHRTGEIDTEYNFCVNPVGKKILTLTQE